MKLWVSVAAVSTAYLAALTPVGNAATVCNEAENSHRGGYVVSGGIVDPNPPARLRGSAMSVGNDKPKGLVNAANSSPALRRCAQEARGPTVTDSASGGGGVPDDGTAS